MRRSTSFLIAVGIHLVLALGLYFFARSETAPQQLDAIELLEPPPGQYGRRAEAVPEPDLDDLPEPDTPEPEVQPEPERDPQPDDLPRDEPRPEQPETQSTGRVGAYTDKLPTDRVGPIYPRRALRLQKEGTVLVRFTVGADGRVKDIVILSVEPPGYGFDDAVVRAMRSWKYEPRRVNGVAVDTPGNTIRVDFTLEDERRRR